MYKSMCQNFIHRPQGRGGEGEREGGKGEREGGRGGREGGRGGREGGREEREKGREGGRAWPMYEAGVVKAHHSMVGLEQVS